jgi:hypothetical protein
VWRDHLIEWRPILANQLQACPPRADTRTAEYTRLGLEISIQAIDRDLISAAKRTRRTCCCFR